MQKIIKYWIFLTSTIILSFNSIVLTLWSCTSGYDREYYVSMLNCDLLKPYLNYSNFVKKYEDKIKTPASAESNQAFNDLYDNSPTTAPAFLNYATLTDALTNTMLGSTKIDVNWTKLYQEVGLDDILMATAQQAQLRFYNIIAKVYHKDNVLRLVQKIALVAPTENTIAYVSSKPWIHAQIMGYGKLFANLGLISQQFEMGFWATNTIISVVVHEYGHAVSNFLCEDATNRKTFNNTPFLTNTTNYLNTMGEQPIPDPAIALINFLDNEAIIDSNDQITRFLLPLIIVRSEYSRSAWEKKNYGLLNEFFAEAFAQWLLTPQNLRGWNWQLLNDFFLHELPKYL